MGRSISKSRHTRPHRSNQIYVWGTLLALVIVGLIIAVALASSAQSGPAEEVVVPTGGADDIQREGHFIGDADAPVDVTVYLDFQCPFCQIAASQLLPPIEDQFVASGDARIEVRVIAILGEESLQAGAAAECANEQGRFWEYHDIVFANQVPQHNVGAYSDDRLMEMAGAIGLDSAAFDTCFSEGRYRSQVEMTTAEAIAAGIDSTPTVLVNGLEVESSTDAIANAITQALQE